jgi:hypothetical protein
MGFFDDFFGGGSSKKSGSGTKSNSSKDSTPTFKSLSEAAKAGYHGQAVNIAGKGKQKVSFGDKSYDKKMAAASNAASKSSNSGGIKSLGNALKNAPKNIARDVGMGLGFKDRDADYYRRTANTIARTQGAAAADRYIKQMTAKGGDAAAGVKNADVSGSVDYGQRIGMLNADGSVHTKYMRSDDGGGAVTNEAAEDDMGETYAENLKRYQDYINSQQPQQPQVTPEMRREALNIFESQQGAGQVPYYMAAARNQYNPNMSPAFQYAAQNYDVLGGSQRIAPRPMEMMSVAERQRINDMAQGMADQEAKQRQAETDYQAGMDMVMRGGMGKGGPRTAPQQGGRFNSMEELMEFQNQNPSMNLMGEYQRLKALEGGGQPTQMPRFGGKGRGGFAPQLPPGMVGLPRTPDYGGGSPNPIQRSPFASMLASRFGGFGG